MSLSIIVATSRNGVIGVDNKLPWHLPNDLKYFKEKTVGKKVIMGRKTFESIGRPLPNRENIILTRNVELEMDNVSVYHDINELLTTLSENEEHIVIGGGEIYELFLPYVNKVYLTYIDAQVEGDTTFFVPKEYKLLNSTTHNDGSVNNVDNVKYEFRVYTK